MFAKLSLLAFALPLVSALQINVPQNPTSSGSVTITWTTATGDPDSFSIELVNKVFNNAFALANNVDPSLGSITLDLPVVPAGDGYTLEAVNIGNINDVYSTSGSFSIGATSSSASSSGSSSASSSGTSKASSATTNSTSTASRSSTAASSTVTTTSPASTSTSTATDTNAPAATQFNSGASKLLSFNSAAFILSVIAGAVGVTL